MDPLDTVSNSGPAPEAAESKLRLVEGVVPPRLAPPGRGGLEAAARFVGGGNALSLDMEDEPLLERGFGEVEPFSQDIAAASLLRRDPEEPILLRSLGARPESVIGSDSRVRVADTTVFPYSAIAALEITAADGSTWVGTAWFVSRRTLITAGHCVYIANASRPSQAGWVRSIRVIPGRNGAGAGSEPFGAVTATEFRSVRGWIETGAETSDYAAILLPEDTPIDGDRCGTFALGSFDDGELLDMRLNVSGYPADKSGGERQTQWYDVNKTLKVGPRKVYYEIDTYGGQSGAPVFTVQGSQRVAVAVHAYGVSADASGNSGTRLNPQVIERIESWKR